MGDVTGVTADEDATAVENGKKTADIGDALVTVANDGGADGESSEEAVKPVLRERGTSRVK